MNIQSTRPSRPAIMAPQVKAASQSTVANSPTPVSDGYSPAESQATEAPLTPPKGFNVKSAVTVAAGVTGAALGVYAGVATGTTAAVVGGITGGIAAGATGATAGFFLDLGNVMNKQSNNFMLLGGLGLVGGAVGGALAAGSTSSLAFGAIAGLVAGAGSTLVAGVAAKELL